MKSFPINRWCLREPIPEIADAARLLDEAVTAHLLGRRDISKQLIRQADMPLLRDYTESLWGAKSPYVQFRAVADAPPHLDHASRAKERMPTRAEETALFQRDGHHCRFCGIPVIRKEVRERIRQAYSAELPWGRKNVEQHAAFQLMWAVPDHVLPHSRGGSSDLQNTIVVCQPCNCARMHYTLEELGLADPRLREITRSSWDGLERFH